MNRLGVEDIPSVKIALIGDSGVGKTTLSTVLATANFDTSPIYRPTVGCNIQVLRQIHDIQGQYFVELWDVGGNPRFVDARPVCYEHCDGYIFLWDSSMEVTYHSLQQWLGEITKARRAEEAQWASEYGMERTESNHASSSSSVRSSPTSNPHLHNNHNNSPQSPTNNIFGLRKQLAVPTSPLLMSAESRKEFDGEFSVPLLIVGNKMDKLSRNDQKALQMACAQQVFVVRLFCLLFILDPIFNLRFALSRDENVYQFYSSFFAFICSSSLPYSYHHFVYSFLLMFLLNFHVFHPILMSGILS